MSTTEHTHCLLLRGVNVGGRNRVPRTDLQALAEEAGLQAARVHLNSGNVLGTLGPGDDVEPVAARLRGLLAERLGVDTSVHATSVDELSALVDALLDSPLTGWDETLDALPGSHVHLVLLDAAPDPERAAALDALDAGQDRCAVRGRGVWIRYDRDSRSSRLTLPRIERLLSGPEGRLTGTARNLRTVRHLAGRPEPKRDLPRLGPPRD